MKDIAPIRPVDLRDIRLAVIEEGPPPQRARASVVLLHGWPEIAFSWRHQIRALADAGYHVLAPDLRGFGSSGRPEGVENYRMPLLVGDVTGLLDAFGIDRAVVVGHDWGAIVAWAMPFYAPERLRAVAGLNVPFRPRGTTPILKALEAVYGPRMYILQFQEEGRCEPILEADMDRTMRFFFRRPKPGSGVGGGGFSTPDLDLVGWLQRPEETWPGEPFLRDEELAVYVRAFSRSGMTVPLHYYRNLDWNWRDMARFQPEGTVPRIERPALMITAELDGVLPPRLADGIEVFFARYRRVDILGAGHWVQQEKPEEVNRALIDWLRDEVA